jgi:hypothetical protein
MNFLTFGLLPRTHIVGGRDTIKGEYLLYLDQLTSARLLIQKFAPVGIREVSVSYVLSNAPSICSLGVIWSNMQFNKDVLEK